MSGRCTHYACRCARAAELAAMGRTREAVSVHEESVECRQAARISDRRLELEPGVNYTITVGEAGTKGNP